MPVKGRKMMDLAEVRLHGPHGSFQKSGSRKWPNTILTARCVLLEVHYTRSVTWREVSMCVSSASTMPDHRSGVVGIPCRSSASLSEATRLGWPGEAKRCPWLRALLE